MKLQNTHNRLNTGSSKIGSAVIDEKNNVVYMSEIEIRNDITKKIEQRAKYRRNRRNRKTRYHKARFEESQKNKDWKFIIYKVISFQYKFYIAINSQYVFAIVLLGVVLFFIFKLYFHNNVATIQSFFWTFLLRFKNIGSIVHYGGVYMIENYREFAIYKDW